MSELGKGGTSQKVSGTPNYIAPEVLLGKNPTFKSDNFAIGAIIYFLYI
jgi:serine/threonine protein kinase